MRHRGCQLDLVAKNGENFSRLRCGTTFGLVSEGGLTPVLVAMIDNNLIMHWMRVIKLELSATRVNL